MTRQLVCINNRVNNSAIRRIRNERGDLVYVVPSYTLPDNCVMNGGLYPTEEIERSYHTLEDTPAPAGHPYDANGDYISASSPDGVIYFQCGIFNKSVQRVQDDRYGHRVYVEKHIHVETAMKTERGKAIIDAIDRGEPIHTSTGVMLEPVQEEGTSPTGEPYAWRATGMLFDHDAILLDEEGAATPADGVGLLVNQNLIKQINQGGKTMQVNSAKTPKVKTNESLHDLTRRVETAIQEKFGEQEDGYLWVSDVGTDYAVFELGEVSHRVAITIDDGNVTIADEYEQVQRVTTWEAVSNAIKSFFNRGSGHTSNQEGNDMAYKERVESALKEAEINFDDMSDEEKMNAYDKLMKGNAAETATNESGEQNQPEGETVVNESVAEQLRAIVRDEFAANKQAEEADKRTALAEQLKANGVELGEDEQAAMSVNSLQALVDKTAPQKAAWNFAQGSAPAEDGDIYAVNSMPKE